MQKKSFKDKDHQKGPKKGSELGAIIENRPENYPPTGQWRDRIPIIDKSKCVGCGKCVRFCPEAAVEIQTKDGKKKARIDYKFCKGEGICAQVCPVGAITMKKVKD
jgi:2-oxoacid:acceptor oxidoreductase delta subunit (pyruvate/2-ketoisovalerate family)